MTVSIIFPGHIQIDFWRILNEDSNPVQREIRFFGCVMPQATFWFASPFKEWLGQRTLTLSWEGTMTLRQVWERLAADYPKLRAHLPREGLQEEAMSHMVAVIVDGDILTLDAEIIDGAKVDVLTPLSGGN